MGDGLWLGQHCLKRDELLVLQTLERGVDLFRATPDQLREVGDCSSAVDEEEDGTIVTGKICRSIGSPKSSEGCDGLFAHGLWRAMPVGRG